MPRRPALSRSMSMKAMAPWSCRSLATSASWGRLRSFSVSRADHWASCTSLAPSRLNWYWVRLALSSMERSCTGCMNSRVSRRCACSRACRRRITSVALASRSSFGLRRISMRPLLSVVLVPSTPMKEDRFSTAGSSSTIPARVCWRSDMAVKEMSWGASEIAWIRPVSCTGKKPLGMNA